MNRSRLATVVRIRRLQERIARGQVAVAGAAVADAETAYTAASDLVDSIAAAAPTGGRAFLAHRRFVEGGIGDVLATRARVDDARDGARRSLAGWHRAAQRLDGVERLDERVTTAAVADEQRRIAAELDDLSVMRHGRGPGR